MARRLYLGRLPHDARSDDVQKLFDGFGKVVDVRVMTGFGFVEFETSRDAEDAIHQFNGKSFMGSNIVVEFAKENRSRRDYDMPERSHAPRRRQAGVRINVDGVSRDTSWQDLKDFGREAGNVSYADIDRDVPGRGILEYHTREDAEHAIKNLDNKELRGQPVRVSISEDRGGPDNFRREDRYRDDRGRDDRDDRYGGRDRYARDRDDRYTGDRYRDDRPRRGRSESPAPRRDDKTRSPRGEYDSSRKSGRDDRGGEPYEKRRDDRRREDRYEDRSSRANGDWSR